MRNKCEKSTESAKYQRQLFRSFRASRPRRSVPGATRLHFVRRLPLAVIFRAFGACLGLSYSAPSALACLGLSYSAPSALACLGLSLFRAFGAGINDVFVQSE